MKRTFTPLLIAWLAVGISIVGGSSLLAQDILPKHVTPQAQAAIKRGLEFLARYQSQDGSFSSGREGGAYPVAMSSLAGMAFLANGNTPSAAHMPSMSQRSLTTWWTTRSPAA